MRKREQSDIPMKHFYDLVRDIIGRANKEPLIVCGKELSALLDTGSMVSTMVESLHFFRFDSSTFGRRRRSQSCLSGIGRIDNTVT